MQCNTGLPRSRLVFTSFIDSTSTYSCEIGSPASWRHMPQMLVHPTPRWLFLPCLRGRLPGGLSARVYARLNFRHREPKFICRPHWEIVCYHTYMDFHSKFRRSIALGLILATGAVAGAEVVTTTSLHVGGFYDGGGLDNHIEHQNYFVGYGTVGGHRTSERRNFFWYHIPSFSGPVLDVSIKLKMLATTSLVFGISPSDPLVHDTTETFRLGATAIDHFTLTDPSLTSSAADAIFETLDDHPVAPAVDFVAGSIPDIPFTLEIHLDELGKSLVSSHRGGDVVFTSWMPSWSEDLRVDAGGHFLEADELLFGLSDVPTSVPAPELAISYSPVPEPATGMALGLGLFGVLRGRLRAKSLKA